MISYRKIGGIHWFRFGRLRVSWCMVRKPSTPLMTKADCDDVLKYATLHKIGDRTIIADSRKLPNVNAYPWTDPTLGIH